MILSLLLRGVTWSRDSHGLFDYESRQVSQKSFKTQSNCKLVRNGNTLELASVKQDLSLMEPDAKSLCQIRFDDSKSFRQSYSF